MKKCSKLWLMVLTKFLDGYFLDIEDIDVEHETVSGVRFELLQFKCLSVNCLSKYWRTLKYVSSQNQRTSLVKLRIKDILYIFLTAKTSLVWVSTT
ncbi:hypothetical protein Avbf_11508 [Armadillidium vulgare]|nr:hypothetical protein Avbf_11508 [Armadillidium vulgare]